MAFETVEAIKTGEEFDAPEDPPAKTISPPSAVRIITIAGKRSRFEREIDEVFDII